jgi:hypothetical protein
VQLCSIVGHFGRPHGAVHIYFLEAIMCKRWFDNVDTLPRALTAEKNGESPALLQTKSSPHLQCATW